MQLDEDVGKVAQATPILICKFAKRKISQSPKKKKLNTILNDLAKALELFMQSLIDQSCQESRSRNAKRLTVAHL